mmetsp:Transcript_512/g.1549  ORF Transcript_512/g.1549 Transcript_512/m.1549 type:complete len:354 (+) Transcript_512:874-1935(+)
MPRLRFTAPACPPHATVHAISILVLAASAAAQGAGGSSDRWGAVRDAVDSYDPIESCVVWVGTAGDPEAFLHKKDGFDRGTVLQVASASKLTTAMAIMSLVADGVMSLDDTPSRYLPWWTADPADMRANVTLRHLLSFTSGLIVPRDGTGSAVPSDCSYSLGWDTAECVRDIYHAGCSTAPGTTFFYSERHMKVAGEMAVAAAGKKDFNDLFDATVLDPLGLRQGLLENTYTPKTNPSPAGGLRCSTSTYASILHAYFTHALLPAATAFEMETDPSPGVTVGYSPFSEFELSYGLGMWIEGERRLSPGLFGFTPWIDRASGYYGIIGWYSTAREASAISVGLASNLQPLIEAA